MEISSVLALAVAGVLIKEIISTFFGNRDKDNKAQYDKLIKGYEVVLKQVTANSEQVKAAQNALISITQNQVTEARGNAAAQTKITEIHTTVAAIAVLRTAVSVLRATAYEALEINKELLTMHQQKDNDGIEVWYAAPFYRIHEKSLASVKDDVKEIDDKVEGIARQVATLVQHHRKSKE